MLQTGLMWIESRSILSALDPHSEEVNLSAACNKRGFHCRLLQELKCHFEAVFVGIKTGFALGIMYMLCMEVFIYHKPYIYIYIVLDKTLRSLWF